MKKLLTLLLIAGVMFCAAFSSGCSEISSELNNALNDVQDAVSEISETVGEILDEENGSSYQESKPKESSAKTSSETDNQNSTDNDTAAEKTYTMSDVYALDNTDIFSSGALEHIFDGTINKKGKATGYHYTMITGSKGEIIEGTRSDTDNNGVFTGKVKVNGVKKNGFSSFYPESWTPQQVVDAINTAYHDALSDPDNPRGSLWIGHCDSLEIDMYLDSSKKITTAYPIYKGE